MRASVAFGCSLILGMLLAAASVQAVETTGASDGRDRLRRALQEAICHRLGYPADQVTITPYQIRLPENCREVDRIRIEIPDNTDLLGAVTVRAIFESDNGSVATLPVPVQVEVTGQVLVARRRLSRHEIIRSEDVVTRRMQITQLAGWGAVDPDSVVGRWISRTINAGEVIDRRCVADVPLVKRGDRVTVAYETGLVRVSTTGTAMTDGYRDQEIMVKPSSGRQLLTVRVLDQGFVRPVVK